MGIFMGGLDGEVILPCSQGDEQCLGIGRGFVIGDLAAHARNFGCGQCAGNTCGSFNGTGTHIQGVIPSAHIDDCCCRSAAHS